jgi:predicted acylesterase/phospholipase RssA
LPWGAVPVESWEPELAETFHDRVVEAVRRRVEKLRAESPDAKIPFRALALSGGGSNGAYGAGVLTGWTKTGERPDFEVVTGISTGALQATYVFLGPEYDDHLLGYTEVTDDDIYRKRNKVKGMLLSDGMSNTEPLRELIAESIDAEMLDAVAAKHLEGHRLFVGTTNLDANAFTIWDMGAIAASTRPDKLERFRDVILASASAPVVFPPVYFPVETDGETYWQMHADGGVRETVFFYDFIDEIREVIIEVGLTREDIEPEIYVLHNGTLYTSGVYKPVRGRTLSIAGASLAGLMRKNTVSSIYRMWVQALIHQWGFHITFIPPDYDLTTGSFTFDQEEMRRLYDYGYERALNGDAWVGQDAVDDWHELIRLLDPMEVLDPLEARPQFRRPHDPDHPMPDPSGTDREADE